jgi:hypothetical protein
VENTPLVGSFKCSLKAPIGAMHAYSKATINNLFLYEKDPEAVIYSLNSKLTANAIRGKGFGLGEDLLAL